MNEVAPQDVSLCRIDLYSPQVQNGAPYYPGAGDQLHATGEGVSAFVRRCQHCSNLRHDLPRIHECDRK